MLAAERLNKIVQLVNERGSIRVSELSELCGVTEETIRRDLDKLESEMKLRRSHGGAVSIRRSEPEIPYAQRETTNIAQKQAIAEEAARRVKPGERIALDASSTALFMARLLPDLPLTVLTNSVRAAVELSGKSNIQVISTGGILTAGSLSFVGPLAEQAMDRYAVDKAFISCKGVHVDFGASEANEPQALVKRKMAAIAEQVYLLVDSSKFGVKAFAKVADWSEIGHLITDADADPEQLDRLRQLQVEVTKL